jgi:hypothetical protein
MIFHIPHPGWVCNCTFLFTHVTVSLLFPLDTLDITLPLLSGVFGNLWTFKVAGILDVTNSGTKTFLLSFQAVGKNPQIVESRS